MPISGCFGLLQLASNTKRNGIHLRIVVVQLPKPVAGGAAFRSMMPATRASSIKTAMMSAAVESTVMPRMTVGGRAMRSIRRRLLFG